MSDAPLKVTGSKLRSIFNVNVLVVKKGSEGFHAKITGDKDKIASRYGQPPA
jgi:hypothetical protein